MNRQEKIDFIKKEYPALYRILEDNVPDIVKDVMHADVSAIIDYNCCVAYFFGHIWNSQLLQKLKISL